MAGKPPLLNTPHRYGLLTIVMHWLVAIGVVILYPLGLYIEALDYYDPQYLTVPQWHKALGVMIALLLLGRLVVRVITPAPEPLASPGLQQWAAKLTHLGLYLLLLVTVISGYLIVTAEGKPLILPGDIAIPALPLTVQDMEEYAGEIHFIAATLILGLASGHMLAALKHHFIDRDNTLKRMLGK
ncbi:cytochrome b [Pontibacter sp. JAM-7]|uniref:cytochrome b n=1 Tax=Pontibacter sp. JAM-7 TaxID=3366581 RepID=UPI003AF9B015